MSTTYSQDFSDGTGITVNETLGEVEFGVTFAERLCVRVKGVSGSTLWHNTNGIPALPVGSVIYFDYNHFQGGSGGYHYLDDEGPNGASANGCEWATSNALRYRPNYIDYVTFSHSVWLNARIVVEATKTILAIHNDDGTLPWEIDEEDWTVVPNGNTFAETFDITAAAHFFTNSVDQNFNFYTSRWIETDDGQPTVPPQGGAVSCQQRQVMAQGWF